MQLQLLVYNKPMQVLAFKILPVRKLTFSQLEVMKIKISQDPVRKFKNHTNAYFHIMPVTLFTIL